MYYCRLLAVVLLFVTLVGCGGGRAQVSGKVVFEDGSPLTKGNIKAESNDGVEVRGTINQDGTFTLFEIKPGDGIPSGKQYKVWIVNANETILPATAPSSNKDGLAVPPATPPTRKQLVHKDFTRANTTSLTLDVPKGSSKMSHDIPVKKP